jgi:hypothetical protein
MEAVSHFNISIDADDDDGIEDITPPSLSHTSSLGESTPLFLYPSSLASGSTGGRVRCSWKMVIDFYW